MQIVIVDHILHLIPAGAAAALPDLNWVIKNIHLRGYKVKIERNFTSGSENTETGLEKNIAKI